jgi:hypothetical protein
MKLRDYLLRYGNILDVDEEESIQAEQLEYAGMNPIEFAQEMRDLPVDEYGYLTDVYEALSYEPEKRTEFFLDEIDRLVELVRSHPDPAAILEPLGVYFLLNLDDEYAKENHDLLMKSVRYLDEENRFARRTFVVLVGDFDGRKDNMILDKLEGLVRRDPDWKVHYLAHQTLEDICPERAERTRLPFMLRLQARFSDVDY